MYDKAATQVNYPDMHTGILNHFMYNIPHTYILDMPLFIMFFWFTELSTHSAKTFRIDWKVFLPVFEFNRQQIITEIILVPHFIDADKSISPGQEQQFEEEEEEKRH